MSCELVLQKSEVPYSPYLNKNSVPQKVAKHNRKSIMVNWSLEVNRQFGVYRAYLAQITIQDLERAWKRQLETAMGSRAKQRYGYRRRCKSEKCPQNGICSLNNRLTILLNILWIDRARNEYWRRKRFLLLGPRLRLTIISALLISYPHLWAVYQRGSWIQELQYSEDFAFWQASCTQMQGSDHSRS